MCKQRGLLHWRDMNTRGIYPLIFIGGHFSSDKRICRGQCGGFLRRGHHRPRPKVSVFFAHFRASAAENADRTMLIHSTKPIRLMSSAVAPPI